MLRLITATNVATIKRHIQRHKQGVGPMVVAHIPGWSGTPQVYDVREELHPVGPSRQQQERRFLQRLSPLPPLPRRLEVQIHPHQGHPWHIAQALYLKIEEEDSRPILGDTLR